MGNLRMTEKLFIKNRNAQNISVLVDIPENPKGLAFVMHGLGGFKEQPHVVAAAQVFIDSGYTVVRFDTTNSIGESDGQYEDATVTNYLADLQDVIDWSATQAWYCQPFVLSGSSLGGMCILLYAQKNPEKVKGLVPLAPVVSGKLSLEAPLYRNLLKEWKETGWAVRPSSSKPGKIKRLKWSHIEDRLLYDVIPECSQLRMPVCVIVGSKDDSTPPEHQQIFFEVLPGPKELHIIDGAPHTFIESYDLAKLKECVRNWLHTIL